MDQLLAAVGVFAGTNVDDLIVLTVLFLTGRANGRPRPWQIVLGQYAGIGALVAISAVAALGLTVVPDRWVWVLGLVPIALGIRAFFRGGDQAGPVVAAGVVQIAAVTIANGADNISVYTPMFRSLGVLDSVVTVAVFAILVALWCAAGWWLGGHRRIVDAVGRSGHWLVPVVFIVIGVVIIVTGVA